MKQVAKAPVGTFTAIFVLMAANVVLANSKIDFIYLSLCYF